MFAIEPTDQLREGTLYEVILDSDEEGTPRYLGVYRLTCLGDEGRCTLEVDEDTHLHIRLNSPYQRFEFYEALDD